MREVVDADRVRRFMQALGNGADVEGRVYFTGGATAVSAIMCATVRMWSR
jgi:hypothetical protein